MLIYGFIGFLIGTGVTSVALEMLHRRQFNELYETSMEISKLNDKVIKENGEHIRTVKRLIKNNNKLMIELAELKKEPEIKVVKINDKVKEEKPWCVF